MGIITYPIYFIDRIIGFRNVCTNTASQANTVLSVTRTMAAAQREWSRKMFNTLAYK